MDTVKFLIGYSIGNIIGALLVYKIYNLAKDFTWRKVRFNIHSKCYRFYLRHSPKYKSLRPPRIDSKRF